MIVDLGEEEDAVTDPAGVSPALEPGEGGVSPHLLPSPSIRRVSAAGVLRIQYRARVFLHPDNKSIISQALFLLVGQSRELTWNLILGSLLIRIRIQVLVTKN